MSIMVVLDLMAMLVLGVSGALTAVRMRLDIVGVLVLGSVTAVGGGWLRDSLIGAVPPTSLTDWRYLAAPIGGAFLTFYWHPAIERLERPILVLDACGLALFSVSGALKATQHGLGPLPASILGLITGIGGGMVRDVLSGQIPAVLQAGELYAIPALAGAGLTVTGVEFEMPTLLVAPFAAAVTIVWRLIGFSRGWSAPIARPSGPSRTSTDFGRPGYGCDTREAPKSSSSRLTVRSKNVR